MQPDTSVQMPTIGQKVMGIAPVFIASGLLLFTAYASYFGVHNTHYVRRRAVSVDSLPYGYYQILRWVVCGVGAYCAIRLAGRKGWMWAMSIVALLFNPALPFRFGYSTWGAIDLIAGVFFITAIPLVWRRAK